MEIRTSRIDPPIGSRNLDWCAVYDNYDGAEDSENRSVMGFGPTEAEAIADLKLNYPL